jgi:hypothetical protein
VIHFVVRAAYDYTLRTFFDSWGRTLAPDVRIHTWEGLFAARRIPAGTWIFGDLERLAPAEIEHAARIWSRLERSGERLRLLNHPLRVKQRYELLRSLRERGVNDFDVYRLTEARTPRRFPVFLRGERDHRGPATGLLHTPDELRKAIGELEAGHRAREGWIATEFAAQPDARGRYRKYAAFNVGGRIVAGHVLFGRGWVVKRREERDAESQAEELRHIEKNPYEKALREVFEIAAIDWGRVDFGVVGGRVQVYEINTNPLIMGRSVPEDPERRRRKELQAGVLTEAFRAIDTPWPTRAACAGRPGRRAPAGGRCAPDVTPRPRLEPI